MTDRRLTELERRVWEWDNPPTDSASQLVWLLNRWRIDPGFCAVECFRIVLTPYQIQIMLDLADSPREVFEFYGVAMDRPKRQVLVPSGHGLGKTRLMAFAMWWHTLVWKFSKVLATAPTSDQITGQLWGELRKLYRRMKKNWPMLAEEWEILSSSVVHRNADYGDWGMLARTARDEKPESLQGTHALDEDDAFGQLAELFQEDIEDTPSGGILVCIEEASGVNDKVRETLEGALSEEGARLLAPGNPTKPDGWFAEALDKTERYAVHTLDCRMSDRTKIYTIPYRDFSGQVHQLRIRGFVRPNYWLDILKDCDGDEGKDRFRVRVAGLKPRSAFDACIKTHWVESAMQRQPVIAENDFPVIGLDFGLTADKHALAVRQGFAVTFVEAWLPKDKPNEITLDAVQRAWDWVESFRSTRPYREGMAKIVIVGDSNGVGKGAMETLSRKARENPKYGVRVVHLNTGAGAVDSKRYHRLRDSMWHKEGRGFFSDPRCSLPNMPALKTQLTTPGYAEDTARKIRVESKQDIKARTGQPSGNEADAILHTLMIDNSKTLESGKKPDPVLNPIFQKHFTRWKRNQAGNNSNYIR